MNKDCPGSGRSRRFASVTGVVFTMAQPYTKLCGYWAKTASYHTSLSRRLPGRHVGCKQQNPSRATAPCASHISTDEEVKTQTRRRSARLFVPMHLATCGHLGLPHRKKNTQTICLVFQMHYTPNAVESTDQSSVGIIFRQVSRQHEMPRAASAWISFVTGRATSKIVAKDFQARALLYGLFPAHALRAKILPSKSFFPPTATSDTLLSVPLYDFQLGQSNYRLYKPCLCLLATRIECTAHFVTLANIRNSPSPRTRCAGAIRPGQEMMIWFVDYCVDG